MTLEVKSYIDLQITILRLPREDGLYLQQIVSIGGHEITPSLLVGPIPIAHIEKIEEEMLQQPKRIVQSAIASIKENLGKSIPPFMNISLDLTEDANA